MKPKITRKDVIPYNSKSKYILFVEVIAILLMLVPLGVVIMHALPSTDDFFNATVVKQLVESEGSYLGAAISRSVDLYKQVSGYFFAAFLNTFFSPFVRGGIWGNRIFLLVVTMSFVVTLYYFIKYLLRNLFDNNNIQLSLAVYILLLFSFINNYNNAEIYSWYGASVAYVLVIVHMLWGIIFWTGSLKHNRKAGIIIASILVFLVSGSSLNITVLNCGICLLIAFFGLCMGRKKLYCIIPFISAAAGALINAMSAGNYARHDLVAEDYRIWEALIHSATSFLGKLHYLFTNTPLLVVIIILFILVFKFVNFESGFTYRFPLLFSGMLLLGCIMIDYPVWLGYDMTSFPDRCVWIGDIGIYFGIFASVFYVVGWIKKRYTQTVLGKQTMICILVSALLFLANLHTAYCIKEYPTTLMIAGIVKGEVQDFSQYWERILKEIEDSEEDDVVIYRKEKQECSVLVEPGITSQNNDWRNNMMAFYYDVNSVAIVYEE